MRKSVLRTPRGMLVLVVAFMGLMGLTAGTASAQLQPGEGCVPPGDRTIVGLLDPNEDGVITIAELQEIADSLDPGPQQDQFNALIDQAEAQGVTGLRYNITGPCPTAPTATTAAPTATTAAPTATTDPSAPTATTAAPTATTAPGTATATTAPGTATATTAPGTATTTPDDDGADDGTDDGSDDGGAGDDGSDDGGAGDGSDDGVNELPETGQGPDSGQSNATLVMLLGGASLFIAAAFLWTQRRTS